MKMTLNIKNGLLTIAVLCCISIATAQQEAQYTQYMYNTSLINPAYSGSEEVFKLSMLHRSQWVGIPGAPTTQTLSLEGMLARRLGASINLSKDVIGPLDEYTGDSSVTILPHYTVLPMLSEHVLTHFRIPDIMRAARKL